MTPPKILINMKATLQQLHPGLPPLSGLKPDKKHGRVPPLQIKKILIQFLDTIHLFFQFKGVFSVRFGRFSTKFTHYLNVLIVFKQITALNITGSVFPLLY